jgi:hypothetical protein
VDFGMSIMGAPLKLGREPVLIHFLERGACLGLILKLEFMSGGRREEGIPLERQGLPKRGFLFSNSEGRAWFWGERHFHCNRREMWSSFFFPFLLPGD